MSGNDRIVFIGAGNMAEALVRGLVKSGVPPQSVTVTDLREERRDYFRASFGVSASADNCEAVRGAGVVVLAVKPQQFAAVLESLKGAAPGALIISIAAGITTGRIEAALGSGTRVVRVMPNTPALVGAGVSALCAGASAGSDDLAVAERLLAAVGATVRVEEAQMDAVTAVSGSGPAYIFRVMEAMEQAGVALGLSAGVARELVLGTVLGAARLAQESGRAPSELREQVTSKGGTTEAALRVLNERDLVGAFSAALAAAAARSRELAGGA
ncbi:MAG: pyrroline-5-carboxylate reductase [Kiritimatiellae bacterium]|nr:pyrroline-5-carboxylate reductase [Kiritimatiellia bacterium]